jgi:drug/metabolite transporter (DMT)-like permease
LPGSGGLANGGIAGVGELQFLQPILGLLLSAAFSREQISSKLVAVMILIVSCVAGARRFARPDDHAGEGGFPQEWARVNG